VDSFNVTVSGGMFYICTEADTVQTGTWSLQTTKGMPILRRSNSSKPLKLGLHRTLVGEKNLDCHMTCLRTRKMRMTRMRERRERMLRWAKLERRMRFRMMPCLISWDGFR
jgi:hypothetical protein